MERLYKTENELNQLPLYYEKKTNEAAILDYNKKEIIKRFHSMNENKVYTLYEIDRQRHDLEMVEELLLFQKIVVVYFDIQGILIEKGYCTNLKKYLKEETVSFNDIVIILQNLGRVLEKLKWIREKEGKLQTFFIGDLQESNILVDPLTKQIQICDTDSCKIGKNKPFLSKYLNFLNTYTYVKKCLSNKYPMTNHTFIPNCNTDLYCYVVLILKFLFHMDIELLNFTDFYQQLYLLKKQGLPEPLYQIFINLYNNVPNENPYKFLDTIPESFERKIIL